MRRTCMASQLPIKDSWEPCGECYHCLKDAEHRALQAKASRAIPFPADDKRKNQ